MIFTVGLLLACTKNHLIFHLIPEHDCEIPQPFLSEMYVILMVDLFGTDIICEKLYFEIFNVGKFKFEIWSQRDFITLPLFF